MSKQTMPKGAGTAGKAGSMEGASGTPDTTYRPAAGSAAAAAVKSAADTEARARALAGERKKKD